MCLIGDDLEMNYVGLEKNSFGTIAYGSPPWRYEEGNEFPRYHGGKKGEIEIFRTVKSIPYLCTCLTRPVLSNPFRLLRS